MQVVWYACEKTIMIIGILDYGAGNLKNVCRAITHLGFSYQLVSNEKDILSVDKLIIPGVGAFKLAMEQIHVMNIFTPIQKLAQRETPILGICLGMQLLFEKSTEFGTTEGLGLLNGVVDKIPSRGLDGKKLKVPHIGWNELKLNNSEQLIIRDVESDESFYFVHSYRANKMQQEDIIAYSLYDGLILPAIVGSKNIYGCQFHPEKSGDNGLKLLKNFLELIK